MPRIIRSPQSEEDIYEIASFIAKDSFKAAIDLLDAIDEKLNSIAEEPLMGPVRSDLGQDLRSVVLGRYLIFYRPIDAGIELVRVLHGARNLKRVLREHPP